jgi:hypothetical protein
MSRNLHSGQIPHAIQDQRLIATGTLAPASTAGVTPSAPFVTQAFRQPCAHCGHEVVFPFDPALSAALDWLLVLDDHPQPTQEEEVTP